MSKESQIRGTLAAFVDAGLVKVASAEQFDAFANEVAKYVPDYDTSMMKIASVADELLGNNEGIDKTAADDYFRQCKETIGELVLLKTANQITDDVFSNTLDSIIKEASNFSAGFRTLALSGRKAKQRAAQSAAPKPESTEQIAKGNKGTSKSSSGSNILDKIKKLIGGCK